MVLLKRKATTSHLSASTLMNTIYFVHSSRTICMRLRFDIYDVVGICLKSHVMLTKEFQTVLFRPRNTLTCSAVSTSHQSVFLLPLRLHSLPQVSVCISFFVVVVMYTRAYAHKRRFIRHFHTFSCNFRLGILYLL